jgi:hypothetical protein
VIVGWVFEKRFKLYVLCCLLLFVSLSIVRCICICLFLRSSYWFMLLLVAVNSTYLVVSLSTLMSVTLNVYYECVACFVSASMLAL